MDLLDWCGKYEEDGDGDDAHIERLDDALRALMAESSAAAQRRALAKVKAQRAATNAARPGAV